MCANILRDFHWEQCTVSQVWWSKRKAENIYVYMALWSMCGSCWFFSHAFSSCAFEWFSVSSWSQRFACSRIILAFYVSHMHHQKGTLILYKTNAHVRLMHMHTSMQTTHFLLTIPVIRNFSRVFCFDAFTFKWQDFVCDRWTCKRSKCKRSQTTIKRKALNTTKEKIASTGMLLCQYICSHFMWHALRKLFFF